MVPEVTLLGAVGYDNTLHPRWAATMAREGAHFYSPTAMMYLGEDRNDIPEVDLFVRLMQTNLPGANLDLFTFYGQRPPSCSVQAPARPGPIAATRANLG